MNKTLIFVILALFCASSFAKYGDSRKFPGTSVYDRPSRGGTVFYDDVEDNNLSLTPSSRGSGSFRGALINRPKPPRMALDDAEDNEMFRFDRPVGSTPPFNPSSRSGFDDAQDNEMALDLRLPKEPTYRIRFAEDDQLFTRPMKRFEKFDDVQDNNLVGTWERPIERPLKFDEAEDNDLAYWSTGASVKGASLNVGSDASNARVRFDDFEDDTLFTQGDLGRMSSPFGSGQSGVFASGGSVPGGFGFGGVGQLTGPIGNTGAHWVAGTSLSFAPNGAIFTDPHFAFRWDF